MRWLKFEEFASSSAPDATLEDIDWPDILIQVWHNAVKNTGGDNILPAWSMEKWQDMMFRNSLVNVNDLHQYTTMWATCDSNVRDWMQGRRRVDNATADIGGWLADYVHTKFLVQTGQARPTTRFRVIANQMYSSLHRAMNGTGDDAHLAHMNAVGVGNIFEHLCWHAFECNRGEFVLAVVWQAANRTLPLEASASSLPDASARHVPSWERGHNTQPPRAIKNIINELYSAYCTQDEHGDWMVDKLEHEFPIHSQNWQQVLGKNFPRGRNLQCCVATFFPQEADHNRENAPRLDLVLTFDDGLSVRYHPKAKLIWSTEKQPTEAMQQRMNLMERIR